MCGQLMLEIMTFGKNLGHHGVEKNVLSALFYKSWFKLFNEPKLALQQKL
jgi:hypothetical protein